MEGRQLAAIAALELMALATLGWRLFRALRAPLLFLVFLVPFGAFITPALQQFTAGFIVRGLNVLGVANYATDYTIEISAGVFYVAEACAGLRFLIAAVAFGVFYALLNYRSPGRRLLFVAASVVVPVLANGVRALGIVVLGAILGSANAAAADHVIYGWVFFSLVMLLLVAGGMPFREDPPDPAPSGQPGAASAEIRPAWAAAAVVLLLAAGPAAAMLLARQATPALFTEALAFAAPPGCTVDPRAGAHPAGAASDYHPVLRGAVIGRDGRGVPAPLHREQPGAGAPAHHRRTLRRGGDGCRVAGGAGRGRLVAGPHGRPGPHRRGRKLDRRRAGARRHGRPHPPGPRQPVWHRLRTGPHHRRHRVAQTAQPRRAAAGRRPAARLRGRADRSDSTGRGVGPERAGTGRAAVAGNGVMRPAPLRARRGWAGRTPPGRRRGTDARRRRLPPQQPCRSP